MLDLDQVQIG